MRKCFLSLAILFLANLLPIFAADEIDLELLDAEIDSVIEFIENTEENINTEENTKKDDSSVLTEQKKTDETIKHAPLSFSYPTNTLIEKYKNEFLTEFGKKWLYEVLQRAAPYRPYIRQKITEYNLPPELEYLPVIESSFKYSAVSKSGAVGLWQFMENSIAGYLVKNAWLDERKDPWLSTDAALKKLQENYNYFGDWSLALAAYNMGLGGLSRAIKASGKNDYWALSNSGYLRTETKNYVPKFIAICDLIINAKFYGIDLPEYDETESPLFDTITLPHQVGLEQIANNSKIPVKKIMELNPALTYPFTPYTKNYQLRIPYGSKDAISKAIKEVGESSADIYTVKQGDTLWAISRKYGLTVNALCSANNIIETDILRIGTTLFVPIIK